MSDNKLQVPASSEIERRVIGALLQFGDKLWPQVESFLSVKDFYVKNGDSKNTSLFSVIKQMLDNGKSLETAIIAEKIKNLGIVFSDFTPLEYIETLKSIEITELGAKEAVKELLEISVKRSVFFSCKRQIELVCKNNLPIDDLLGECDKISAEVVTNYKSTGNEPVNLFDNIEEIVVNYAKQERDLPGLKTAWNCFNRTYGGLAMRNSYCFAGRTGEGKSSLLDDLAFTTANLIDQSKTVGCKSLPVIKLDTEMTREEARLRLLARLSGVSPFYISTGKFKYDKTLYGKVMAAAKELSTYNYHHIYCPYMNGPELVNTVKRFAFKKLGRDTPFIIVWDYAKVQNEGHSAHKQEYQILGDNLSRFNELIKEKLNATLLFGLQMNRLGINTNGKQEDSANSLSGSDRIMHYASFLAIIRRKTLKELVQLPLAKFGSHKLIVLKNGRSAGEFGRGHIDAIKIGNEYVHNFINLDFNLFKVDEKGDAENAKSYIEGDDLMKSDNNKIELVPEL